MTDQSSYGRHDWPPLITDEIVERAYAAAQAHPKLRQDAANLRRRLAAGRVIEEET